MVPKCFGEDCVTIGYSIVGDPDPNKEEEYSWIDEVMRKVAKSNDLQFERDVKKLTVGTSFDFTQYLELNPNSTQYSVVWCTDQWNVSFQGIEISVPCKYSLPRDSDEDLKVYTLWYNQTLQDSYLFKPS
mmetsp:Transcript_41119/g.62496  ORF Transcript_41119/g.62496 Transcript_41119/m.62496 type:complete len:130 (+) Transcript_41119:563-952(+)